MVLNFGKHSGKDLSDVPEDYLGWLIDTRKKELQVYEAEVARRKAVEEASQSDLEKLIQAGYRALAQKAHPDKGGSAQEFQALQAAYEQAKMLLQEVKLITGGGSK